jgi:hypothetical protein
LSDHAEVLKAQLKAQFREVTGFIYRLDNWARYVRDTGARLQHCASIEYRYLSPQHWWPEDARISVDELDGALIEKTINKLPEFVRIVLRGHYVYGGRWASNQLTRKYVCRDIAIHKSKYDEEVHRAEKMLENALDRAEKIRHSRG